MKLIDEKYQKINPTFNYLSDEVIIAQAWKKTHSYMRTHNWYADTLALDISALGLEVNLESWSKKANILKAPHPLELVPAAKSDEWVIDKERGWVAQYPNYLDPLVFMPSSILLAYQNNFDLV